MEFKSLTGIRNVYPEERSVQSSYSNKGNSINYAGKYKENSLNFTIEDLSGVSVVGGTSFNFILEIDGREYTSPQFKSFLEKSLSSGNPYIQKSSVTRVSFTKNELTTAEIFDVREKYSEVQITDNLDTVNELIKHIDWLVSREQTLRDVSDYGKYTLNTTEYNIESDSGIGFEYSDAVESGTPYVASNDIVTTQPEPKNESKKTLTTQQIENLPIVSQTPTNISVPISYDISNPFTVYKPSIDFLQYRDSNLRF